MSTEEYTGPYTVIDQRASGPMYDAVGEYPTLAQAANRAKFKGALILRSVGLRYDIRGMVVVSSLVPRCGVTPEGSTFVWPV